MSDLGSAVEAQLEPIRAAHKGRTLLVEAERNDVALHRTGAPHGAKGMK